MQQVHSILNVLIFPQGYEWEIQGYTKLLKNTHNITIWHLHSTFFQMVYNYVLTNSQNIPAW